MNHDSNLRDIFYNLLMEFGDYVDVYQTVTSGKSDWGNGQSNVSNVHKGKFHAACLPERLKLQKTPTKGSFERLTRSFLFSDTIDFDTSYYVIFKGKKYQVSNTIDMNVFTDVVVTAFGDMRHE